MVGYDRALVEHILPVVFDDTTQAWGLKNEMSPDADMPKGFVDKKKGSSFPAHVADVRQAWKLRTAAGLSLSEQQAVFLCFALDLTVEGAGRVLGCHKSSVSRRVERGVGKLTAFLNGVEYVDGYDGVVEDHAA
ncbi:hypothetical protein ABZY93_21955 [Streptomyces smyrnaeus]|uniref:hypothetical protein n=1 Tax=Streptomyces smyrnaeus TaxID=1387713 RepID=UPI0033A4E547